MTKRAASYEVTVSTVDQAQLLSSGTIESGEKQFTCDMLYTKSVVVSLMHLPADIEDSAIVEKLRLFGIVVESVSFRHFYKDAMVADGKLYCRCTFPAELMSLVPT